MRRQHGDTKINKKRIKAYKKEPEDILSDDDDLPLRHTLRNKFNKSLINHSNRLESTVNTVQNTNPLDLCCCCLELFCTKNLWLEYTWMDQGEIYGDMLRECFDVKFPSEWGCREKICEVCITRLRNSYRFKRQVVLCQAKLQCGGSRFDPGMVNYGNEFSPLFAMGWVSLDRRTLSTHRSDYIRPRQNVGLLLEHSTIIPFKSNKGYFNCLYCNKQYIVFEQLRVHVLDLHKEINFRTILKSILRPNDRIKADISDMTCRHCGDRSETLERLVQHLESHNVKFNYDEKLLKPTDCVLPYNLSNGKYKCCVCDKEFPFFKTLTKHMNDHSTNFVCDVCGKCFLLPERLRAHVGIHVNSNTVNCEHCGKICASNAHLRSHKRHHHKKRSHVCCICNKSFPTFKERMQHLQEIHNRSPPDLDCKICLKRFKTTSHLGCHVRTEHFNIPYVRKRKSKRDDCQRSVY
ncbi:hypothetical protein K1T71_014612 [Dendrolimus kikuchii]|uniref:Uncharacterized protein n=1 Tax=Dendrolimus kikuchii TaxID=765133 RepID=A0ACC1CEM8_9NEOP|nr:hypothetical protein K1T71_014612 [Dendrolimus kikuchii]